MALLYADEHFPRLVSELLRDMGHDVLTVQEARNANLGIPDEEVLAFAVSNDRAIVTINRFDLSGCIGDNLTMLASSSVVTIRIETRWQCELMRLFLLKKL